MKFQVKLPSIQVPAAQQGGAVVVGDWLALVSPVLQGLSPTAGRWWRQVLGRAQALYAKWLSATPLERLEIRPSEHEDRYPVGAYCRVVASAVSLLLEVLPEVLTADVVASRVITCVAVLFAVFKRFQPGGPSERAGLLSYLSQGQEAGTAVEAAQLLRQWRRWHQRAVELQASLPDPSLQVVALDKIVKRVAAQPPHSHVAFRISTFRNSRDLDFAPTQAVVLTYSELLLAEFDNLANSAPLTDPKKTTKETPKETPNPKLSKLEADSSSPQGEAGSGKGKGGGKDAKCKPA